MPTRRQFLTASAAGLTAGWPDRSHGQPGAPPVGPVHEVTIAAPDIVCVEVRDGPVRSGRIVRLDKPSSSQAGEWVKVGQDWGRVLGRDRSHVRTSDEKPAFWLDRGALDDAALFPAIGSRRVISVHRKSVPYDSCIYRTSRGETVKGATLKHFLYLRLDGGLSHGDHQIAGPWPGGPVSFRYHDRETRAIAVRATQHGHRPNDVAKIAYLALWLPGGPDRGAVDFATYGINTFNIIDASGRTVFEQNVGPAFGPDMLEGSEAALLSYEDGRGGTWQANRSGTYVHRLDYSGWQPARAGWFRVHVPGLGVSDPFMVGDGVWYAAAKISLAGLYHHRSGIALDGRFGYRRPVAHRPGVTGPVLDSRLPYLFSSENPLGFVPFESAAQTPWITQSENAEAWGGYMDAGDWDRRTDHLQVTNGLLLLHELVPPQSRHIAWGLPKTSAVLDPGLYGEMDGQSDVLHEAAFGLDVYRRMQRSDGAIRGAIESEGAPKSGEPSWLESQTVFAYAPDHQSAWRFAAAAARFARVVAEQGCSRLAGVYRSSAAAAFGWAESVHANLDAAYAEALDIAHTTRAFGTTSWDVVRARIVTETVRPRASAAAALYRSTGEARYRTIFERLHSDGLPDFEEGGDAIWDYVRAPHPDFNIRKGPLLDKFAVTARRYILEGQAHTNFVSTKWKGLPMTWGQGNAPDYNQVQTLLRAHARSQDPAFLACLQAALGHVFGANQSGLSMTTGIGVRSVRHPLHEDHMAMSVPAPVGITIYGYGPWQHTDYPWVWSENYWAPLPSGSGLSSAPDYEQALLRRVHPHRKSMPLYEYVIEHPLMIMQQEYTVPQTINTMAVAALYLHAHDGNSETALPRG